jgi:TPP-dependent pyruvate/acetoin dehydrogenase alpha subunit
VLFLCENNGYAIHTHQRIRQRVHDICARAAALGLPAERIEDGDVLRIAERATAAADAMRGGDAGPFFLECMTYRWKEHVGPGEDWNLGYRDREEAEPWMRDDQVVRMASAIDPDARKRIETEVEAEIAEAFAFAEQSPFPADDALHTQVFREPS